MRVETMLAIGGSFVIDNSQVTWKQASGRIVCASSWSNQQIESFLIENAVGGFDSQRIEMLRDKLKHRIRQAALRVEMAGRRAFHQEMVARLKRLGAQESVATSFVLGLPEHENALIDLPLAGQWTLQAYHLRAPQALVFLSVCMDVLGERDGKDLYISVTADGQIEGGRVFRDMCDLERLVRTLGYGPALTEVGHLVTQIPELMALRKHLTVIPTIRSIKSGALRSIAL